MIASNVDHKSIYTLYRNIYRTYIIIILVYAITMHAGKSQMKGKNFKKYKAEVARKGRDTVLNHASTNLQVLWCT